MPKQHNLILPSDNSLRLRPNILRPNIPETWTKYTTISLKQDQNTNCTQNWMNISNIHFQTFASSLSSTSHLCFFSFQSRHNHRRWFGAETCKVVGGEVLILAVAPILLNDEDDDEGDDEDGESDDGDDDCDDDGNGASF